MASQAVPAAPQQATGDRWKTFTVQCKGGLNTSEDTLSYQPGEATQLVNFEPSVYGGYRRVSGYTLYDTNAVPGTGKVLGTLVWNGSTAGVVACRQNDVYFGSGSGWNTKLTGPIAVPAQPVLSAVVSGALAGATYFVKTTYTNASGETTVSPEANLVVAANSVVSVTSPAQSPSNGATGYNVYVSTSTGTETKQNGSPIAIGTPWQEPNTGLIAGSAVPSSNTASIPRTGAGRYMFGKYYFGGKRIVSICDGVNPAGRWDGTTYSLINGVGAPTNPKFACFFLGSLVLAGYTSGGGIDAITLSAPSSDADFNGSDGAVEIKFSDTVTGIRTFRDVLYVFCQRSIFSITNVSASGGITLNVDYVASGIGCTCYDSIQEVNGDLVYLAEDGIRTISGTMKLNDVELGTLSKPILNIANQVDHQIGGDVNNVSSVVVREKNQYRLFYNTPGQANGNALGILGAIRPGKQMMTQFGTYISIWEWGTFLGIRPVCCDSDLNGVSETVIHGMDDGFVYQQELGTSFNGTNIVSAYTTAPSFLDDPELRKLLQKITVYYRTEGVATFTIQPIFDFNDNTVAQPPSFIVTQGGAQSIYGTMVYGAFTYGGNTQTPRVTNNTQGSGRVIQLEFSSNDQNPSFSIQGISLQYRPLGRR